MTKASLSKGIFLCFIGLFALGLRSAFADVDSHELPALSERHQAAQKALRKGKTDKALVEVRLALRHSPLDAESHYLLASLLAAGGEDEQAIVGFRRALTLDPTHPEALHNLGTLLLRRGQTVEAAEALETAVLTRSDYVAAYNNLAKAYYLAGLPELAFVTYEEALRLDPTSIVASTNLKLLREAGLEEGTASFDEVPEAQQEEKDPVPEAEKRAQEHLDEIDQLSSTTSIDEGDVPAEGPPDAPDEKGEKGEGSPPGGPAANAKLLRELLRDLPNVNVEKRANRVVLTGWTSGPRERLLLDKIIGASPRVLDLTSDDFGDPQRMLEVDVVLFLVIGVDSEQIGFNFFRLIETNLTYFASSQEREWTGLAAPGTTGAAIDLAREGWLFSASVDYDVNIANATDERVAVLARPHLTTLSGTPASFLAGGEFVFEVSGLNSGDIKPYSFGTSISVTPTLLRTPGEDGQPRIHIAVEASRSSVLEFLATSDPDDSVVFDKLFVTSEAILDLDQTLILGGLNQRESRSGRSGVPILRNIPVLKYFFSTKTRLETNTAIMILLTPRDPAYIDEENQRELKEFVDRRRALARAEAGTVEDLKRFRASYPDWIKVPPNRFASHFFLTRSSELYRSVSGEDLQTEDLDLDLLGKVPKVKGAE